MVDTLKFYQYLLKKEMDFFAGVPDSLLSNLSACVTEKTSKEKHIISANEGNAIALAAGYHLSNGKIGVAYMQNSGIGNTINPLLSLTDEKVYSIPVLLIIGWRGEPGTKDEPQHVTQGALTLPLLETMNIESVILEDDFKSQIDYCYDYMKQHHKPIALVVKKGTFTDYQMNIPITNYQLTRELALETILSDLNENDFVVSTTGKASREIFELREKHQQDHANDFLTVGSMGHTASIALGVSLGTEKDVYCVDGDGSFLMHMGSFPINASVAKKNFKYIMINNGAHESVGGQPTIAFDIDIRSILLGSGFEKVYIASTVEEIKTYLKEVKENTLHALIINSKQGSRPELGRPTTTPIENKLAFMEKINE